MSTEAIGIVIDVLNEVGQPYIVTGSIVSSAYSEPRSTKDADFVVACDAVDLKKIFDLLALDFVHEPQMSFETVTGKHQHRFRFRRTPFEVEIFEANFDDPHERARFERRLAIQLLGRTTYFPRVEDALVGKLRWYKRIHRLKDRLDIVSILKVNRDSLDWPYVERWCREHETFDVLAELREESKS